MQRTMNILWQLYAHMIFIPMCNQRKLLQLFKPIHIDYIYLHFSCSIPCVSYSGLYVFDLMDTYGGGLGVLWVAIFETVVLMWIYGVSRFSDDLGFMLKHKVSKIKTICVEKLRVHICC